MAHPAACGPAVRAISRDLDGRLPGLERRRLRAHLRDCEECASFVRFQRERRKNLRRLRLVKVPASLEVCRVVSG
jgi:anti-sigma factor RsiW